MPDGYDTYCIQCNIRKRKQRQEERSTCSTPKGKFRLERCSIDKYEQFKQELAWKLAVPCRKVLLADLQEYLANHPKTTIAAETLYARMFGLYRFYCTHSDDELTPQCFMDSSHNHFLQLHDYGSNQFTISNTTLQ